MAAFASHICITQERASHLLNVSARSPPRQSRTPRRRRACCVHMGLFRRPKRGDDWLGRQPPPGADWDAMLSEMDAAEADRRRTQAEDPDEESMRLSDAELDNLFENFPILKKIDTTLDRMVQDEPGLDPSSTDAFSFMFRNLSPVVPRPVALALLGAVSYLSVAATRKGIAALRARMRPSDLALLLVRIDAISAIAVLLVLGSVVLAASLARKPRHSDAPRRLAVMFAVSAVVQIPAAAAMLAAGWARAGFVAGAFVRLVTLPMTLWMWSDLSQEVFVMRICERLWMARIFCLWRWLMTATVLVGGGVLRAAACFDLMKLPVREVMFSHAVGLRIWAANRFPVALSLMADPGGLGFLGAFALAWCFMYTTYVVVFLSDFLMKRRHRETLSPFAHMLIETGVFLPNALSKADRERLTSTAPEGTPPYFASPSMLMKRPPPLMDINRGIGTDETPRFLQMVDDEEAVMKSKNMDRWGAPRNEFVAISEDLSEGERSMRASLTWARAIQDGDDAKTFTDFFESIEDDTEFEYDPATDEWVFSADSKSRRGDDDDDDGDDDDDDDDDDSGSDVAALVLDDVVVKDLKDLRTGSDQDRPKSKITFRDRLDPDAPGSIV